MSNVEVGNGEEFPDFVDLLFFFGIKNVWVGGKILGLVGRSETHIFLFGLRLDNLKNPILIVDKGIFIVIA